MILHRFHQTGERRITTSQQRSGREFGELCQVKVPPLRIRSRHYIKEAVGMKRNGIAICLRDIGEVISFDELGCQLIKLNVRKQHSSENKTDSSLA